MKFESSQRSQIQKSLLTSRLFAFLSQYFQSISIQKLSTRSIIRI